MGFVGRLAVFLFHDVVKNHSIATRTQSSFEEKYGELEGIGV